MGDRPFERFFHQIQGFLDCRNTIQRKWEIISNNKLDKEPSFSSIGPESRQQNLNGEIVQNIEQLFEAAKSIKLSFDSFMNSVLLHANVLPEKLKLAPLKGMNRALEKAKDDYSDKEPGPAISWLFDIVRGTIVCENEEEILSILTFLLSKTPSDPIFVVRFKNRFREPTPGGFRDLNLNLLVKFEVEGHSFSHICELQIHCNPILELSKDLHSHEYYEYFRTYFRGNTSKINERLTFMNSLLDIVGRSDSPESSPSFYSLEELIEKVIKTENKEYIEDLLELLTLASDLPHVIFLLSSLLNNAKESKDTDPLAYIQYANRLGTFYQTSSRYSEAEALYRELQAFFAKISLTHLNDPQLSILKYDILNNLAVVDMKRGFVSNAKLNYQAALDGYLQHLGEANRKTSDTCLNLAHCLSLEGKLVDSLKLLEKAEVGYRSQLDPLDIDFLGLLNNKATVLKRLGRDQEALQLYRDTLMSREKVLGIDHLDSLQSAFNLALYLCDLDLDDEAMELVPRLEAGYGSLLGHLSDEYLSVRYLHGRLLLKKDKLHESKEIFEMVESGLGELFGPSHPRLFDTYQKMAQIFENLGESENALNYIRKSAQWLSNEASSSTNAASISINMMIRIAQKFATPSEAMGLYSQVIQYLESRGIQDQFPTAIQSGTYSQPQLLEYQSYMRVSHMIGKKYFDTSNLSAAALAFSKAQKCYSLLEQHSLLSYEDQLNAAQVLFDLGRVSSSQMDLIVSEKYFESSLGKYLKILDGAKKDAHSPEVEGVKELDDSPASKAEEDLPLLQTIADCHNQLGAVQLNQCRSERVQEIFKNILEAIRLFDYVFSQTQQKLAEIQLANAKINLGLFFLTYSNFSQSFESLSESLTFPILISVPNLKRSTLEYLLNCLEAWEGESQTVAGSILCASGHEMCILDQASYPYLDFICDNCGKSHKGFRWFCTTCSEDLCLRCQAPDSQFLIEQLSHTHSERTNLASSMFGPDHPSTLSSQIDFAEFLTRTGRLQEASAILRSSFPALREEGSDAQSLLLTCRNLREKIRK